MDTMGEKDIPIDTFDALLRDLVTWDLVVRGEGDDAQTWRLVARAQQRLGELAIARGPWPAERTVYLDRLCADCGRRHLTWVRDGTYVCNPCWQKRAGSTSHRNELGELLRWFHESERLARTVVEARGEPGEVLRAVHGEIGPLRHVLTQ